MAITPRTAQEYATAVRHLLPPGTYFTGDDIKNLTSATGEELARIDAKINDDFDIETIYQFKDNDAIKGWTLNDYALYLQESGLTNFQVSDHEGLGFFAGDECGNVLGNVENALYIIIRYQDAQQTLFDTLLPDLQEHKLAHTRILAIGLPSENYIVLT